MRWFVSLALALSLLVPGLALAGGKTQGNVCNGCPSKGGGTSSSTSSSNVNVNAPTSSASSSKASGGSAQSDASSSSGSSSAQVDGSTYLPDYPDFVGIPYAGPPTAPKSFMNDARGIYPTRMTREQAKTCREPMISDSWEGPYWWDTVASDVVELIYTRGNQSAVPNMEQYIGTSKVKATDKYTFIAALCEAAYHAMEHGATRAYVSYVVRPKNKTSGLGIGTSGGGMSTGAAAGNPYALAGVVGLGTGVASSYVEGELLLHLTVIKE